MGLLFLPKLIPGYRFEFLNIDRDTELEMTTDGDRLIIEPIRSGKKCLRSSAQKIMKKHDSTFRKLAK